MGNEGFADALSKVLRAVADALNAPVQLVLIVLMACTVVLTGTIIVEALTERARLKVKLPELVDAIKASMNTEELRATIESSGLLKRQKAALTEITNHPELTDTMREALAVRLLEEEKARYDKIVKCSDIIAKLGPMFGLLGTLIPLGPGIVALGQGDTFTLSSSLLVAFDTTIAGLISAAFCTVISSIRKTWYSNYMSILDALMECVLEMQKTGDEK